MDDQNQRTVTARIMIDTTASAHFIDNVHGGRVAADANNAAPQPHTTISVEAAPDLIPRDIMRE